MESFSFGAQLTTSIIGGGGGAGKPTIHELTIVKPMDSTSPKLFESCVIGRTFPTVELSVVRDSPNREPYLKVRLNDVLVSSYSTGGTGDTVPTEQLSLNFTKIEFAYIRYDDKGTSSTVSATYDVIKNTIKTAADQSVMQLP